MNRWIFPIIAVLLLTGCWDKVELENRGFVVSLGIDKFEDRYQVTMAIPNANAFGEKGSDEKANSVKSMENRTIAGAMGMVDSASSRTIYYGQAKMAVLGEALLNDEKLFRETIDALERNREINRKTIIMSCKGDAKGIIEADIPGEPMVGMFVANYYKNNANRTGITFRQDLDKILMELRATGCTVIPRIEEKDGDILLSGAAVMKGFKLAGFLDNDETRGYLWLNGGCKDTVINVQYEDGYVPVRVGESHSKVSLQEEGVGLYGGAISLQCNAIVYVQGSIAEYTMAGQGGEYAAQGFNDEDMRTVGKACEETIAKEIMATAKRMQQDFNADGYLFLEQLRKKDYPLFLQVIDNWGNIFASMKIMPVVQVEITGTGAIR